MSSIRAKLERLERNAGGERPHATLVCLDSPPDGKTAVRMSDGSTLPDGADWRDHVHPADPPTVVAGIDLAVVVGARPGLAVADLGGPAPGQER